MRAVHPIDGHIRPFWGLSTYSRSSIPTNRSRGHQDQIGIRSLSSLIYDLEVDRAFVLLAGTAIVKAACAPRDLPGKVDDQLPVPSFDPDAAFAKSLDGKGCPAPALLVRLNLRDHLPRSVDIGIHLQQRLKAGDGFVEPPQVRQHRGHAEAARLEPLFELHRSFIKTQRLLLGRQDALPQDEHAVHR